MIVFGAGDSFSTLQHMMLARAAAARWGRHVDGAGLCWDVAAAIAAVGLTRTRKKMEGTVRACRAEYFQLPAAHGIDPVTYQRRRLMMPVPSRAL